MINESINSSGYIAGNKQPDSFDGVFMDRHPLWEEWLRHRRPTAPTVAEMAAHDARVADRMKLPTATETEFPKFYSGELDTPVVEPPTAEDMAKKPTKPQEFAKMYSNEMDIEETLNVDELTKKKPKPPKTDEPSKMHYGDEPDTMVDDAITAEEMAVKKKKKENDKPPQMAKMYSGEMDVMDEEGVAKETADPVKKFAAPPQEPMKSQQPRV